ncbi:MAG: hypothetical protein QOC76_6069 [Mycobacterium sp.]|nr:hypothetical protein [Mycobacterium sp.]
MTSVADDLALVCKCSYWSIIALLGRCAVYVEFVAQPFSASLRASSSPTTCCPKHSTCALLESTERSTEKLS